MDLKPYAVTIRVFDPDSDATVAEHVLPVDNPDPEHAAASALATAASFMTKTHDGTALVVAFRCMRVENRA